MDDAFPKARVAVVQAAPVLFDREASTQKACRLVADAAAQGAQLILFPEAFIPAYPRGVGVRHRRRGPKRGRSPDLGALLGQLGGWAGPATEELAAAAQEAGAYLAIGVVERDTQFSRGTLSGNRLT